MSQIVGLITARGGSKSIPRKNVKLLAGKPLIAWTIEAALQSHGLSRVIVSTDDDEIARVSKDWGAEVPFMRPRELAQDDSPHVAAVIHAVQWLAACEHSQFDYVLLLQPTSPLRTAEDIDNAIQLAVKKDAEGVVGVCETHHHPYLVKRINEDGTLGNFVSGTLAYLRRQDLPPAYFDNGAIYLTRCDVLLEQQTVRPNRSFPYIMPPQRSLQIDDPWDFELIELILEKAY